MALKYLRSQQSFQIADDDDDDHDDDDDDNHRGHFGSSPINEVGKSWKTMATDVKIFFVCDCCKKFKRRAIMRRCAFCRHRCCLRCRNASHLDGFAFYQCRCCLHKLAHLTDAGRPDRWLWWQSPFHDDPDAPPPQWIPDPDARWQ